jgi:outer membrane protein assembly factor BamB
LLDYEVVSTTSQIRELWRHSNLYVVATDYGSNLVALEHNLFFAGSLAQDEAPTLYRINSQTGEVDWKLPQVFDLPIVITHDSSHLITASGVPVEINAYDAYDGNHLWRKTLPVAVKGTRYLLLDNNSLYVNSVPTRFEVMDLINGGNSIEMSHSIDAYPVFLISNGYVYHRELANRLQASLESSGAAIWQVKFDDELIQIPVFTDEIILVRTGDVLGNVYAIDRETGRVLWGFSSNVVSNIAVSDNNAYFLTVDSHLRVVNLQTGELIGEVVFAPSLQELEPLDLANRKFYVAASEDIVAVYFGSSRQLFTFQLSPEG